MYITFTDMVLFTTYFFLLFLSIFWILILFTAEKEEPKRKLKEVPSFTAIVPAYNEEATIKGTLTSLANLDYPEDKKEIIVINDGSTDHTPQVVEEFIKLNPQKNITLINQENQGKGRAMNVGLEQAQGKYFACLDADSFIASNALEEMLPYFDDQDVAAVCPLLKVKKPGSILQKVQWVEYMINMFYKFLNAKLDCIHVTPGPFSVYRIKIIKELGGYDEQTITEDLEIAIRLQKHHYKIVQTFDAVVETVAPNTWKQLFRQRIRWYKGSIDNGIAYKEMIFNKEYGDFGYVRMPTIFLSGIVTFVLLGTLTQQFFIWFSRGFQSLKAVNFDLLTLIKNYTFHFNFLSLPFFKFFIALTLIGLSFFVMIYSYRLVKERLTNHGRTWISLITYVFIYGLFISVVWAYIGYMFVKKKSNSWY